MKTPAGSVTDSKGKRGKYDRLALHNCCKLLTLPHKQQLMPSVDTAQLMTSVDTAQLPSK
jgi:hypothetical protein